MWLYPRPSCLDCSFSEELSEAVINTWIHKVLDHGANLNPGAGPTPLREGVASTRVSLLDLFWQIVQFHPLIALVTLSRVSGVPTARRWASTYLRTRRSRR
jgi:hypothetical protein